MRGAAWRRRCAPPPPHLRHSRPGRRRSRWAAPPAPRRAESARPAPAFSERRQYPGLPGPQSIAVSSHFYCRLFAAPPLAGGIVNGEEESSGIGELCGCDVRNLASCLPRCSSGRRLYESVETPPLLASQTAICYGDISVLLRTRAGARHIWANRSRQPTDQPTEESRSWNPTESGFVIG